MLQGGHPKEATEASFDIIVDNPVVKHEYFTAETIMVICQVLQMFVPRQGKYHLDYCLIQVLFRSNHPSFVW